MTTVSLITEHIPRFKYLSFMKRNTIINHTIFQHIVFWVLYFLFNLLRWGLYFDDFNYSFQSNLVEFTMHIIIVYFNLAVLVPRFFPFKMARYVFALFISTSLISVFRILLTYQLVTTEVWKETNIAGLDLFDPNYFVAVLVGELYVVGFTMAIKLGIDYINNIKKTKELENNKLEAELSFLRSQIQPHFFFNTLNNLYSLALTQSKKAPETVLKLSELMSYVIYEGKSKRVKLSKEIKHIHDYLDLEKLRYSTRLETSIEINGNIENCYMPPLILVPFIENCFKHGDMDSEKIPLDIKITVTNSRLNYSVTNNVKIEKNNLVKTKERGGIGIKNAIRRLDLLFKNEYSLDIHQEKEKFTVELRMPIYDQELNSR